MEVKQAVGVVVSPGQRWLGNDRFPGLIVRVLSQFPYTPSYWVCVNERTGCQVVLSNDDLGKLLPERG
jgi:hypothetical protein